MVDVEFVGQLVSSMDDAVSQLQAALAANNTSEANKLRTFIFSLHTQIEDALVKKNV